MLNDGHSTSIVEALTNGSASDLAMEASYTPQLRYGYYSPYIASIIDIGRILGSFHTAQYQYLPALPSAHQDHLTLTLTHRRHSITRSRYSSPHCLPSRRRSCHRCMRWIRRRSIARASPDWCCRWKVRHWCSPRTNVHDVALSLTGSDGRTLELPAAADARQGGFVVDITALGKAILGDSVVGTLHGYWGFDLYQAPTFQLVNARQQSWALSPR